MKVSLEQSTLKLFEKICQTRGMDNNNILFSPYAFQQVLSFLSATLTDETFQNELEFHHELEFQNNLDKEIVQKELDEAVQKELFPYISPILSNESLLNTKSDLLIFLRDESRQGNLWDRIQTFQRKSFGEEVIPSLFAQHTGLCWALQHSAEWQIPFNKNNTRLRPFYLDGGEEIQLPTMEAEFSNVYSCTTADYEVVGLPGTNQSIVYFVKPKRRKNDWSLWHIYIGDDSTKAKKNIVQYLWNMYNHRRKKVLRRLWDICNHDDELHHTITFQMPKISIKKDVFPLFEFISAPVYPPDSIPLKAPPPGFFSPVSFRNIYQSVRLYLNEVNINANICTSFDTILSSFLFPPNMTRPGLDPPKSRIIKMDSPYFIVIKDKTPDGVTHIVCTAWISDLYSLCSPWT